MKKDQFSVKRGTENNLLAIRVHQNLLPTSSYNNSTKTQAILFILSILLGRLLFLGMWCRPYKNRKFEGATIVGSNR